MQGLGFLDGQPLQRIDAQFLDHHAEDRAKTIDAVRNTGPDKGKTEPGIYKIEGDTLTYCVTDIGKERPTAFATKEGTKNSLFVLKRVK